MRTYYHTLKILLIIVLFSVFSVFGADYKISASKVFGKAGTFGVRDLAPVLLETDNPSVNDFRLEAEMIIQQYFSFSLGWISGSADYTMSFFGEEYYPTNEKNLYVVGMKSYFNAQQAQYFVFNAYLGIDILAINNQFKLSSQTQNKNNVLISFSSSVNGNGVGLNLGGEFQFITSGIRVAIVNQEIYGKGQSGDGTVLYTFKDTDILIGVYLFF